MAETGTLSIMTEADAWLLLENTLAGKLPIEADFYQIEVGPWPILRFQVTGNKFNSSLNPRLMQAFVELQQNIYRSYAKLHYNVASGKVLDSQEKAALELMVEVRPGSSEIEAKLEGLAKKFIEGMINKMEAKHFVILGVTGIITWGTVSIWNGYFTHLIEQKKIDIQMSLSKEETRRLQLMKEASNQVPYVASNIEMSEEVVNKLLKGASTANSITIGENTFNREQINKLIRPERSASKEIRLDGEYRILKVDSSKADYFKVELQSADYKRFWAVLQDTTVTKQQNKHLLQEAEWNKQPINLAINGREVKGDVTSAAILDVKDRYLSKK